MEDEASPIVACPTCAGPLTGQPEEWVCEVGHHFTFPALADAQAGAVVRSLWYALRALEDRAIASDFVATDLARAGLDTRAGRMRSQRAEDLVMIDRLHDLLGLLDGMESRPDGHVETISHDEPSGQGSHQSSSAPDGRTAAT